MHTASSPVLARAEALAADMRSRYAHEPEFLQAATEVIESLHPLFEVSSERDNNEYLRALKVGARASRPASLILGRAGTR